MTDAEIRGVLLVQFHELRHANDGWVPISDINLAPHPVELRVIGGVCQQLADVGLIQWKPLRGSNGFVAGMGKITGQGVAAIESGRSAVIDILFPLKNETVPSASPNVANAAAAAGDEISEEGRRTRFEQWEQLGLDQVKHDLLNGGHCVVGGPPQVRQLAWEWVRIKESQRDSSLGGPSETTRALGVVPRASGEALDVGIPLPSASSNLPASSERATVSDGQRTELITLKPTFMGMSIDLKELVRRFWPLVKQRWGRSS